MKVAAPALPLPPLPILHTHSSPYELGLQASHEEEVVEEEGERERAVVGGKE